MGQRWQQCDKTQPDDERLILVARPDRSDVEPAHWFEPEQAWVTPVEHVQIYPTLWRDMPPHPFTD